MIRFFKESIAHGKGLKLKVDKVNEVVNDKFTLLIMILGKFVSIMAVVETVRSRIIRDNKNNIQVVFQTMSFPLRTILFKM